MIIILNENYLKFDFTYIAEESLYRVVDDEYFRDKDSHLIYKALEESIKPVPFCEYLKRYIYTKAKLDDDFENIDINEYRMIIRDSFYDNNTPASFTPTTAKLSALSKNWLTQKTVNRNVVFLLGFGLRMSADDVNDFLTKALLEQGINFKNPFEIICWYCYKNRYSFQKFERLYNLYLATPANTLDLELVYSERTVNIRDSIFSVNNDAALLAHLSKLKTDTNKNKFSVTAYNNFCKLYDETKRIASIILDNAENEKHMLKLSEYRSKLLANDRIYDYEKRVRIKAFATQRKKMLPEDITEADIESIFCSAIPVDKHGNLVKSKLSTLNEQFYGKRLSRQHLHDVISGNIEVDRFDLITLNFFIYSQSLNELPNSKQRYSKFIESTNKILTECYMSELYVSNPYECFVLMCILSDDPLGTYADVIELSYE